MAKTTSQKADQKKPASQRKQINTLPIYIVLIVSFILYIFLQHDFFLSYFIGTVAIIALVAVIVAETLNGIREYGFVRNVIEIVAVVLVVVLVWYGLKFFLNTKYPLDVVPSCSMLPVLQRGSVLLLHGVNNVSQLRAPIVEITPSTYNSIINSINSGALACVAYKQSGSTAQVSQYMESGYALGLYDSASTGSIVNISDQSGPIRYECGVAPLKFDNGSTRQIVYTSGIVVGNTTIKGDKNNSIVVYSTTPQDLFYKEGDSYIVHRVYAILNSSGSYYVLTKGDNNPGLDIQYSNYPAGLGAVQGKVVASIPYLGYLKLVLSSQFSEPSGCNSTIQN